MVQESSGLYGSNRALAKKRSTIQMQLKDNGCGFDPGQNGPAKESGKGFGLTSMRERTELSGGSFLIASSEGTGTRPARSIKQINPRIRTVILTDNQMPEYRKAAADSGADHFLSKSSATAGDFLAIVEEYGKIGATRQSGS